MKRKPSRRSAGHGRNGKAAKRQKPAVARGDLPTYSYHYWTDAPPEFAYDVWSGSATDASASYAVYTPADPLPGRWETQLPLTGRQASSSNGRRPRGSKPGRHARKGRRRTAPTSKFFG